MVEGDAGEDGAEPDGLETALQMARISTGLFPADAKPVRLGRFVVLERLGSGAMGTVLRAYDPQLDRSVAIKVLRSRAHERDPGASARMAREARTLAKLNHPNVVAVHEVGYSDDQIFVAMEMVEGGDLAGWLAAHPDPRGRFAEALRLVLQAGHGLAAAHEAGVVHRDFKPANLLIGKDHRVRVADFGLARAFQERVESSEYTMDSHGASAITRTGSVVGTPAYMAPEQREGESADALADQYSFCVTAWEALFGVRPEPNVELERPANLDAQARSVAAVLRRGLSKDRASRYPHMAALLDGLTRNPVQRRRRAATATLGLLAMTAVVAGFGMERAARCNDSTAAADATWSAPQRHRVEQGFLATDWAGASQSWDRFAKDADDYVAQWKASVTDSCRAALIDGTLEEDTYRARAACFDDRMTRFSAVLDVYSAPPRELVVSPFSLTRALGPLQTCIDHPGPASSEARPLMTELARGLGTLEAGREAEGVDILRKVVEEAKARGVPLVEAHARAALGEGLLRLEGPQSAAVMSEQAYWMAVEHGDDALAARLASSLVQTLADTSDLDAAERWVKPASALAARVGLGPADRSELEQARGRVAYARGDFETAQEHFEEGLRLAIDAWGPEHPEILAAQANVANCLRLRGELDRAVELAKHALDIRRAHFGEGHPNVARSHHTLGTVLGMHHHPAEAAEHFTRAVEIFSEVYGRQNREVASSLTSLGQAMQALGDEAKAEAHYREAVAIFDQLSEFDGSLALTARMNLGRTLFSNGRCAEAVPLLESVVQKLTARSELDPRVGLARWMLGASLVKLRRAEDAAPHLEAALSAFEGRPSEQASIVVVLARMHRLAGDTRAGLDQVQRAFALLEPEGTDPLVKAEAHVVRGWLRLDQGDRAGAQPDVRDALALCRAAERPPAAWLSVWGEALRVLVAAGDLDQVRLAGLEALEVIEDPAVAGRVAPALVADVYLSLAESSVETNPVASRAWAGEALIALEGTDEPDALEHASLARQLARP